MAEAVTLYRTEDGNLSFLATTGTRGLHAFDRQGKPAPAVEVEFVPAELASERWTGSEAARARVAELEAALQRIAGLRGHDSDYTLSHTANIAERALAQKGSDSTGGSDG